MLVVVLVFVEAGVAQKCMLAYCGSILSPFKVTDLVLCYFFLVGRNILGA